MGAEASSGGYQIHHFQNQGMVNKVIVFAGSLVDKTVFFSDNGQRAAFPQRNDQGGNRNIFQLNPGEYITQLNLRVGQKTDQIQFVTSMGRVSPAYGGMGGSPMQLRANPGYMIVGLQHGPGKCPRINNVFQLPVPAVRPQPMPVRPMPGQGMVQAGKCARPGCMYRSGHPKAPLYCCIACKNNKGHGRQCKKQVFNGNMGQPVPVPMGQPMVRPVPVAQQVVGVKCVNPNCLFMAGGNKKFPGYCCKACSGSDGRKHGGACTGVGVKCSTPGCNKAAGGNRNFPGLCCGACGNSQGRKHGGACSNKAHNQVQCAKPGCNFASGGNSGCPRFCCKACKNDDPRKHGRLCTSKKQD